MSERGTSALVWLGRELASHSRGSAKGFPVQQSDMICAHCKISSVLEQGGGKRRPIRNEALPVV